MCLIIINISLALSGFTHFLLSLVSLRGSMSELNLLPEIYEFGNIIENLFSSSSPSPKLFASIRGDLTVM